MDPADTKEVEAADPKEERCRLEEQWKIEGTDVPSSVPGPVKNLRLTFASELSPITEISVTLGGASIATPTSSKQKVSRIGKYGKVSKLEEWCRHSFQCF